MCPDRIRIVSGGKKFSLGFESERIPLGLMSEVSRLFKSGVINQGAPVEIRYNGAYYLVEKQGEKVSVRVF